MGRELIVYVIWCGGHQLVSEFGGLLGSLTHFCPETCLGTSNIHENNLGNKLLSKCELLLFATQFSGAQFD